MIVGNKKTSDDVMTFFFVSDTVYSWFGLRHRFEKDVHILLSTAQSKGVSCLLWRHFYCSAGMARRRNDLRNVWFRSLIQVNTTA